MEHADLINEMPHIEQMPTQERLILAKRRRTFQLKVWMQREKEYNRKPTKTTKSNKRSIFFNESVVLLEAAARNDIDEGNFFFYLHSPVLIITWKSLAFHSSKWSIIKLLLKNKKTKVKLNIEN